MRCVDERHACDCGRLNTLPNNDTHVSDAVSIDHSDAELTVIDRIHLDPFERNMAVRTASNWCTEPLNA